MFTKKDNSILFTVTKNNLNTGLRDLPVGYCSTSFVDSINGLHYRNYSIADLCKWSVHEVMYLLYFGHKGSSEEIQNFIHNISSQPSCDENVIDAIYKISPNESPMKTLSIAILMSGIYECNRDYLKDCWRLLRKLPAIVATIINASYGEGNKRNYIENEFDYVGNFVDNISGVDESFEEIMRIFCILHMDHGGGNLSTFVGKAVASGLEDIYGSVASGMSALAGSRHGNANVEGLKLVKEVLENFGDNFSEDVLEKFVDEKIKNKELIYGFGHAVLRAEDVRAAILYDIAQERFPNNPLVKVSIKMRNAIPKILKKHKNIKNPYPNVDAISGTLLSAAGFDNWKFYSLLFGFSRIIGITAQIIYDRCKANNGKGTPIIRPKYIFDPLF